MSPSPQTDAPRAGNNASTDIVRLAYEESRDMCRRQIDDCGALDAKAATLLGAAGVILGLLGGLSVAHADRTEVALAVLMTAVLILTMVCLVRTLWVRSWDLPPRPSGFREYFGKPETDVLQTLYDACDNAHEGNRKVLTEKVKWLRLAFLLLLADGLVAAVFFVRRFLQ
jgi:hypothetical protein